MPVVRFAPHDGKCVACRAFPYDHVEEFLCVMCYTSPFYTKKRELRRELMRQENEKGWRPGEVQTEPFAPSGHAPVKADGGGLRFDEGKTRVDLLPADAMLELGKVYGAGAVKYEDRNWERGMHWSKCLGPLMRHLFKWMMGEVWDMDDAKDGAPPQRHIAKVAWNAIALLTYELRAIGVDDVTRQKEKK